MRGKMKSVEVRKKENGRKNSKPLKPRSVLTKEKKYTSLHLRQAVGKNRKKIKTGE